MDVREWIKRIVGNRWIIAAVHRDRMLVKCPARGCGVGVYLKLGQAPSACDPNNDRLPYDRPIADYEDLRRFLIERRKDIGFTQEDIDRIVGWADRYTGKIERELSGSAMAQRRQTPTLPTLIEWAQALGYELVLRPKPLPSAAQGILSEKVHPRQPEIL